MIVLYPVVVLSVITGHGLVFAHDVTPTTAPAPVPSHAEEAVSKATVAPAKTDPPPIKTEAPVKVPSAPKKGEASKTSVNDGEDAPMADDYDSVDKGRLASTLERITKALDTHPSRTGTAAIPLLPGKNYDFFLLKVPTHEEQPKPTERPQSSDSSRNLDYAGEENGLTSVNSSPADPAPPQSGVCRCSRPPAQVAPDLELLQSIYGNPLRLNSVLDQGCAPGMVPVIPSATVPMPMMPAIDGIPVNSGIDFNALGQGFYNQYSPNSMPNYQQLASNYYPMQNPYSPQASYPQGETSPPFPQVGPNLPLLYPKGNIPDSYPQNAYNGPQIPYQPTNMAQLDATGTVPYGQSNTPYGNPFQYVPQNGNANNPMQTQHTYQQGFPGSFREYIFKK